MTQETTDILETILTLVSIRKDLKITKTSDKELINTKRQIEKDITQLYTLIKVV